MNATHTSCSGEPNAAGPPGTVILLHGYLGFGAPALPGLPDYFNGVAEALEALGLEVLAPGVARNGRVVDRAERLAKVLRKLAKPKTHQAPQAPQRDWMLLAHSMGGLDARWLLAAHPELAARVHSLVTLGTPFAGSPVADAFRDAPERVPALLRLGVKALLAPLGDGLGDLTRSGALALSQACVDPPGIHRFSIVGGLAKSGLAAALPLAQLGQSDLFGGEPNDGLVRHHDARWPGFEALPDWQVNHAGLIGWGALDKGEHLARYRALVQRLRGLAPAES